MLQSVTVQLMCMISVQLVFFGHTHACLSCTELRKVVAVLFCSINHRLSPCSGCTGAFKDELHVQSAIQSKISGHNPSGKTVAIVSELVCAEYTNAEQRDDGLSATACFDTF